MKKLLTLSITFLLATNLHAQKENSQDETIQFTIDSSAVKTLNGTLNSLYSVISGEKGVKRNWKQFKYLFKPDAKLIPSGKSSTGVYQVRYMSPSDYIKSSGTWLEENGFFEKEISRRVNTFGPIAQVFSTYESFYSEKDTSPFMRGINSIQLLNDGKRWWVINIYWSQETEDNPIPKAYLPD